MAASRVTLFPIFKDQQLIGHSRLEKGDTPMGVAFGAFIPALAFDAIRTKAEPLDADSRQWQGLTLKLESGKIVDTSAGVTPIEYGPPDSPITRELTALGIAYPQYETLFPHHVKAYDEQFK